MITVELLTKKYGKRIAVDGISFSIGAGEIVGFLGPNGAGKSTTMNIVTGYLSATSGKASVGGVDVAEDPEAVKRKIGYLPEHPPLYPEMTAEEYLRFAAELKGVPREKRKAAVDMACGLTGVADVRKRVIKNLSKGFRQRVGLAQALVAEPDVLILDEPTIGLDPKQIAEIRDLIRNLGRNRTVILSSHILNEIAATCSRVLIMDRGRIVADGATSELAGGAVLEGDSSHMALRVEGESGVLAGVLGSAALKDAGLQSFEFPQSDEALLTFAEGKDPRRQLFFALAEARLPILSLRPLGTSLEDVFLRLTAGETQGATE